MPSGRSATHSEAIKLIGANGQFSAGAIPPFLFTRLWPLSPPQQPIACARHYRVLDPVLMAKKKREALLLLATPSARVSANAIDSALGWSIVIVEHNNNRPLLLQSVKRADETDQE